VERLRLGSDLDLDGFAEGRLKNPHEIGVGGVSGTIGAARFGVAYIARAQRR
jgi:hypothetical protein